MIAWTCYIGVHGYREFPGFKGNRIQVGKSVDASPGLSGRRFSSPKEGYREEDITDDDL